MSLINCNDKAMTSNEAPITTTKKENLNKAALLDYKTKRWVNHNPFLSTVIKFCRRKQFTNKRLILT